MSVNNEVTKITQEISIVNQVISLNGFYFQDDSQVSVVSIDADGVVTARALTTDYTLTGAGDPAYGNLTVVGGTVGDTWFIVRDVPITQLIGWVRQTGLRIKNIETATDKLTLISLMLQEELDRSLKFPSTEPTSSNPVLPSLSERASKYAGYDSSGNPVALASPIQYDADSLVAFDTVADLQASTSTFVDGEIVILKGYYVSGDMDARILRWNNTSTTTANDGTVFKLTTLATGRFFYDSDTINVKDYGASGDGVTISTTEIQSAMTNHNTIHFPDGTYQLDDELTLKANQCVIMSPGVRINQTVADKAIFKATSIDNAWILAGGAILYGEGSWSSGWTGNSGHNDRVVQFIDCTNSGITNPVIKNGANAGLYVEGCESFMGTNLRIEGTNTHGTPLPSQSNFQNGIYVKHSATYGDCRDCSFTFDISGTAQGILEEAYSTYTGQGDSTKYEGTIHDITGQHGLYLQAGNATIDVIVRNIELSGVKAQVGSSGHDLKNFIIKVNADTCGSHALEIQNANVQEGEDDTSSAAAFMTDTTASFTVNEFVGDTIFNLTDGSSATITANTATTVTGVLSGGSSNDWNSGDDYQINEGGSISGVIADVVAHDCSRGLGIDNDIKNVDARVNTEDCGQYASIIQGVRLENIDIYVNSIDTGRDGILVLAKDSSNIRIHDPVIEEAASGGGSYSGIRIGSLSSNSQIEIINPSISDENSNMQYGIFNESDTTTFGVYGKITVTGYANNAVRTSTETVAFPTDASFSDLKDAFQDRTFIQGKEEILYGAQTTSTSQVTLYQKALEDGKAYRMVAEVVANEDGGGERAIYKSTALFYASGGSASLEGSVVNETSVESASWQGNFVGWGANSDKARIRIASDAAVTNDWVARVKVVEVG